MCIELAQFVHGYDVCAGRLLAFVFALLVGSEVDPVLFDLFCFIFVVVFVGWFFHCQSGAHRLFKPQCDGVGVLVCGWIVVASDSQWTLPRVSVQRPILFSNIGGIYGLLSVCDMYVCMSG